MATNKKINRIALLDFIKEKTNLAHHSQQTFTGKNIYFLCSEFWNGKRIELEEDYQIEFIPQNSKYFFTILVRGLKKEADFLHEDIATYLRGLQLNRNIILDTELKTTLIN